MVGVVGRAGHARRRVDAADVAQNGLQADRGLDVEEGDRAGRGDRGAVRQVVDRDAVDTGDAGDAISGMPFTVTATELNGTGFEQFGGLDNMADGSPNAGDTGGQVLIVTSAIKDATLTKLCQSVDLGGTNLLITAGTGSQKVEAHDLTTDSTELTGDAAFDNIEIGNDASTLDKAGVQGPIGVFSQQADTVRIANLRQTNYATTAGVFKLPGLKLRFSESGC
ncbi:DUF6230 family protein [Streptomyces sp. NPDC001984]|uniref:DUF6230 family protein n=1 Tax=Streptomyces sp. NPDC002619 TaxID=3364655 RepID=UPI003685E12D